MKYTRVFNGNQYITKFKVGDKRIPFLRRVTNRIKLALWTGAKICVIAWMVVGGLLVGQHLTPASVVYADKEVPTKLKFEDIPMLVKICKAESGGGHQFNKDGSVVRGKVNPSDIGYCQINEYINNDEARKLGYDIFTEEGNKDYAIYLFTHRGTEPWNSSKPIWSKM